MARILVVDDVSELRQSYRRILEQHGYEVDESESVADAKALLTGRPVDLILCDVEMPGERGLGLVDWVSAKAPDTTIFMVTGTDDPAVADDALSMGACGYAVKPLLANELLITVASGLRRLELERAARAHVAELESKVVERGAALAEALTTLDERTESAAAAERETVDQLVIALTLRSEETGTHLRRVGRYAAHIGQRLEGQAWSEEELRLAAMLHDVGKIGISDSVLLKPGPLTAEEFSAVQRHPAIGQRLLSAGLSPVLVLGARIAATHHERWDGTGYPGELAGTEIPIEGRITAVADVFDALTSDRVYRKAYSIAAAFEIIESQREKHFDPGLVDLFLETPSDIFTIFAMHQ